MEVRKKRKIVHDEVSIEDICENLQIIKHQFEAIITKVLEREIGGKVTRRK